MSTVDDGHVGPATRINQQNSIRGLLHRVHNEGMDRVCGQRRRNLDAAKLVEKLGAREKMHSREVDCIGVQVTNFAGAATTPLVLAHC
jgi:hypothetical protein